METLILLTVVGAVYFLPTIIAVCREHHNQGAIFMLNMLLGWSILGWVAAIVWASTEVHTAAKVEA